MFLITRIIRNCWQVAEICMTNSARRPLHRNFRVVPFRDAASSLARHASNYKKRRNADLRIPVDYSGKHYTDALGLAGRLVYGSDFTQGTED